MEAACYTRFLLSPPTMLSVMLAGVKQAGGVVGVALGADWGRGMGAGRLRPGVLWGIVLAVGMVHAWCGPTALAGSLGLVVHASLRAMPGHQARIPGMLAGAVLSPARSRPVC